MRIFGAVQGRADLERIASGTAAARIRIWDASVDGRACNGSKSRKALCKQQAAFIALLELADSYTVRATDMRLLQGSRPLIHFVIETPDGPAT